MHPVLLFVLLWRRHQFLMHSSDTFTISLRVAFHHKALTMRIFRWPQLHGAIRRILVHPTVKMLFVCNVISNFRRLIAVESWYRYFPPRKLNGILSYMSFAFNVFHETRRICCYMSSRKTNTCETEMLSSMLSGFSVGGNLRRMHLTVQFVKKHTLWGAAKSYSYKLIC